MERTLARWFAPWALIFGIAGDVLADDGSGLGDGPFENVSKAFKNEVGKFSRIVTFEAEDVSRFESSLVSRGLDGLYVGLFEQTEKARTLLASHKLGRNPLFDLDFALNPGRYSLLLSGDIVDQRAGYSMMVSAVPVPETSPWLMLLAGVAMIAVIVRRRQL